MFAALVGLRCGGVEIETPVEVFPLDGAFDVPLHSTISVQFSRKPEGVLPHNALAVRDELGAVIGGELEASGDLIRFMPAKPLEPNHRYTAELVDGIVLEEGRVGEGVKWSFQTDFDAAIAHVTPAQNAREVAIEQIVAVTFNRPVGTFPVSDDEVLTIEGVEGTVTREGNSLVFTPSTRFRIAAEYVATMQGTMTDDRGRTFDFDYSWQFRTRDGIVRVGPPTDVSEIRAGNPQMAATAGSALVAWFAREPDGTSLMVREVDADGHDAGSRRIRSSTGMAELSIDANSTGSWIAAWEEHGPEGDSMWAAHYDAATAQLVGPTKYEFNEGTPCRYCLQARISENGNFILLWTQRFTVDQTNSFTDVVYSTGADVRVLGMPGCSGAVWVSADFDSGNEPHVAVACDSLWLRVWQLGPARGEALPAPLTVRDPAAPQLLTGGEHMYLFWREGTTDWWAELAPDGTWQNRQVIGWSLYRFVANSAGELAAISLESTNGKGNVYVLRRYLPNIGWLPREPLLSEQDGAFLEGVAIDRDSNVSLVFNQRVPGRVEATLWRSYGFGSEWSITHLWENGEATLSVNSENELTFVRTVWSSYGAQFDFFRFD